MILGSASFACLPDLFYKGGLTNLPIRFILSAMEIIFHRRRLKDLLSNEKELRRRYGQVVAKKVILRMSLLREANTLEALRRGPGRCHELTGERSGQLSIDIDERNRLVFRPDKPVPHKEDGGLDWHKVERVVVIEITDYH